jgi:hypothetical protein
LKPNLGIASIGAVVDNADGSYTFSVTAGTTAGMDMLVINADDGFVAPDLFPYLSLRSDAVQPLHLGYDSISAMDGDASLALQFNLPGLGQGPHVGSYALLASLNGTSPGTPTANDLLPLNPPIVFLRHGHPVRHRGNGISGNLDSLGRASEQVDFTGSVLLALMGRRIDFAALYMDAGGLRATNACGVQILP